MSSRYPTVAVLPGTGPESDEEGGSVSSRGSGVSQAAGPDETLRFTRRAQDMSHRGEGKAVLAINQFSHNLSVSLIKPLSEEPEAHASGAYLLRKLRQLLYTPTLVCGLTVDWIRSFMRLSVAFTMTFFARVYWHLMSHAFWDL